MYQGENQTALESQKSIGEAFLKLMNEKQYSGISVREICTEAGVSRQTFYTLFETKENVVMYLMKRTCTHPKEECLSRKTLSLDLMCDSFAEFIYVNFDFLKLMMEHDLYCVIYKSIYRIFSGCGSCGTQREAEIYSFVTGGITSFISCVVTDERNKDLNYLKEAMKYLFRGAYFEM